MTHRLRGHINLTEDPPLFNNSATYAHFGFCIVPPHNHSKVASNHSQCFCTGCRSQTIPNIPSKPSPLTLNASPPFCISVYQLASTVNRSALIAHPTCLCSHLKHISSQENWHPDTCCTKSLLWHHSNKPKSTDYAPQNQMFLSCFNSFLT